MESLLFVSSTATTPLLSTGSSCWRSTNLKAGHFPGTYVGVHVLRCKAWNVLERCSVVRSQWHHRKHHDRSVEEKSIFHKKNNKKFLATADSGHLLESESGAYKRKSTSNPVTNALDAFYRFSRPHTIIGTVKFTFNGVDPAKVKC